MSRPTVRRLTAGIVLLTVLCFALPAMAATGRRQDKAPAASSSLLGQLLSWLEGLWSTPDTQGQPAPTKTIGFTVPSGATDQLPVANSDHSGLIDPNG